MHPLPKGDLRQDQWNHYKQRLEDPRPLLDQVKSKVQRFLHEHPLNIVFIRKEKGKLPYSVFKPHALKVNFIKSIFEGRQSTLFFPYPSYVRSDRKCDRIREMQSDEVEPYFMSFKVADNTHIYNAVVNSCK